MLWTTTEEYVIRTMESSRRTAYSILRLMLASSILFSRFLLSLEYSLIQDRQLQFIPSKPLTTPAKRPSRRYKPLIQKLSQQKLS
jgi:hypothetical protein